MKEESRRARINFKQKNSSEFRVLWPGGETDKAEAYIIERGMDR